MSLFENIPTWTKQGDIGEARAIYEYTRLGYVVSKPICDSARYDLVVDKGSELVRVQVKTTGAKSKSNGYRVNLRVMGGNQSYHTRRNRQDDDYDEIFVLTEDNRCWIIPTDALGGATNCIVVGNEKYQEFMITG